MEKKKLLKQNKKAYESFVKATNEIPKILKDQQTIEKSLVKKVKELMQNGQERERRSETSSFLDTSEAEDILEKQV
ncbi:MAG: hypothetical protein ACFFDF_23960 [Candidatus Odinarchaeota archaeon]